MSALGPWDLALLGLVSTQATVLAYIPGPKSKALITALPVPFSLAALAVGLPVGTANVVALNVLLAYAFAVRWLHVRAGWAIVPSIALPALGYGAAGALLKSALPESRASFWIASALTLAVAAAVHKLFPPAPEPDHHRMVPPWLKFPLVAAVIFALLMLKRILGGFLTLFPMIGVFAAFEGRFRLRAFCRAFDAFAFAMVPFLIVVRLLQTRLGLGPALAAGWLVYMPILWLQIRDFGSPAAQTADAPAREAAPRSPGEEFRGEPADYL